MSWAKNKMPIMKGGMITGKEAMKSRSENTATKPKAIKRMAPINSFFQATTIATIKTKLGIK